MLLFVLLVPLLVVLCKGVLGKNVRFRGGDVKIKGWKGHLRSFWPCLRSFGVIFGVILVSFWGNFGVTLGSHWGHFGVILGSC